MTSNDVITVELFNSKMETMMSQIQLGNERLRNELNARIDKLETRIEVLDARLTVMSIGFSIVAIIVALMALAPAIANFFQRLLKPSITLEEVRELMHEEVGTAVSKALGQSGH